MGCDNIEQQALTITKVTEEKSATFIQQVS